MQYRIAVINHRFKNFQTGLGGWGWSLGAANVPKQFATYSDAAALAENLSVSTAKFSGDWEFKIIEGPPFDLPEPRNFAHAKRSELPHNR